MQKLFISLGLYILYFVAEGIFNPYMLYLLGSYDMNCLYCGENTKVIDTRATENAMRRRRECETCEKRFTTYERPEMDLLVVKKDGKREKFKRDKLLGGLLKACEKRPIPRNDIEKVITKIENNIRSEKEIESQKIGNQVMDELLKLDKVAYIRFASVYRDFKSVKSFEKELKRLKK